MNLAALKEMAAMGLTIEQAIKLFETMGDRERSAGAERQARFRARRAVRNEGTDGVTGDVTDNVTSDASLGDAPPSSSFPPSPPPTPPPISPNPSPTLVRFQGAGAKDFDAFWAKYPRRVGKDAARKAYASALKRITGDDGPAVILAALSAQLEGWTDAQFIPHPATWLNQGRWQDDIEPPTGAPRDPTRPHGGPASAASDPRRANTESRRRAWIEAAAERSGQFPGGSREGPGADGGMPNRPPLTLASYSVGGGSRG